MDIPVKLAFTLPGRFNARGSLGWCQAGRPRRRATRLGFPGGVEVLMQTDPKQQARYGEAARLSAYWFL